MKQFLNDFHLAEMLNMDVLDYTDLKGGHPLLRKANALFLLVHEERAREDGTLIVRIIEHYTNAFGEENAPQFDSRCLWNYSPLSASIALAKATPHIWNAFGDTLREKLTFAMEMFLYLESFSTSDFNAYRTGPGLEGNYYKTWNPNYRLANVPVIVFATHFFGEGDMQKGCVVANNMLHAFNEEKYNEVIARLAEYKWNNAYKVWTTEAKQHADGTFGTDAKTILLYGGPTYAYNTPHTEIVKEVGDGLGVANGGNDYLYNEIPLSSPERIVEHLLFYNYSGGPVKSDHHFDVNKDGEDELVAWILDHSISPYQGQMGMMRELASGNRSSTGYCSHDFQLTTILMLATDALGICRVWENKDLWALVRVGNEDFFYKNEIGYQGYATGSYGVSTKTHSEENEGKPYFALKYLWKTFLLPIE